MTNKRLPPAHVIDVQLHDPRWKKSLKSYRKDVQHACMAVLASATRCEVTIVLADDALVKELNATYRGQNKPTNVLSFPACENTAARNTRRSTTYGYLGDVVLAYETVRKEAAEQEKTFGDHAVHLLVHGVLHLMGYDHQDDISARKMETLEIKILKKLGVSNPYLS